MGIGGRMAVRRERMPLYKHTFECPHCHRKTTHWSPMEQIFMALSRLRALQQGIPDAFRVLCKGRVSFSRYSDENSRPGSRKPGKQGQDAVVSKIRTRGRATRLRRLSWCDFTGQGVVWITTETVSVLRPMVMFCKDFPRFSDLNQIDTPSAF